MPTACLMIQLAWMTLGMSLNRASRSRWLSGPSHRNLQRCAGAVRHGCQSAATTFAMQVANRQRYGATLQCAAADRPTLMEVRQAAARSLRVTAVSTNGVPILMPHMATERSCLHCPKRRCRTEVCPPVSLRGQLTALRMRAGRKPSAHLAMDTSKGDIWSTSLSEPSSTLPLAVDGACVLRAVWPPSTTLRVQAVVRPRMSLTTTQRHEKGRCYRHLLCKRRPRPQCVCPTQRSEVAAKTASEAEAHISQLHVLHLCPMRRQESVC